MQALISLSHFCELHGPRLLISTQPVFLNPDISLESRSPEKSFENSTPDNSTGEECCEACHSMCVDESTIYSYNEETGVKLISSKFPTSRNLIPLLKQACSRSLSCEICPQKSGMIYFGDEKRGHVLSYTFFLKDANARGFQRLYSIIVFMWDQMLLLNSWNFFDSHLQNIVSYLTMKASAKFDKDSALSSQRAIRLSGQDNSSGNVSNSRSLPELTGLSDIYLRIHVHFSWILLLGGLRYKEELVEGPPLPEFNCSHSDGNLIGTKKQDAVLWCLADPKYTIRSFYNSVGHDGFLSIMSSLLTGGCCIITSKQKEYIHPIVKILLTIAPSGLCLPAYVFVDQTEMWNCHLAGNPIQLEVHCKNTKDGHANVAVTLEYSTTSCKVISPGAHVKCPSYLSSIVKAIKNEGLSDQVLCTYIRSVKVSWNNKIKTLTSCLESGVTQDNMKKLYRTFSITDNDLGLLKFWSNNKLS